MRELLEGDILQPPFSVGNKQRRNYIYPTKRGYKRWANAGHDRHTIMSKLDSTKALYQLMKSENKYTKRITLESVPYQGDI